MFRSSILKEKLLVDLEIIVEINNTVNVPLYVQDVPRMIYF